MQLPRQVEASNPGTHLGRFALRQRSYGRIIGQRVGGHYHERFDRSAGSNNVGRNRKRQAEHARTILAEARRPRSTVGGHQPLEHRLGLGNLFLHRCIRHGDHGGGGGIEFDRFKAPGFAPDNVRPEQVKLGKGGGAVCCVHAFHDT